MGKAEGSVAREEWHGHVTALSVAPEFRRLGLAAKLMEMLEEISERFVSWSELRGQGWRFDRKLQVLSQFLVKLKVCFCLLAGKAGSSWICLCECPIRWQSTCTNVWATASTGRSSSITLPVTGSLTRTPTVRSVTTD